MTIDRTTLEDLSVFRSTNSVFALINRCTTQEGTEHLRKYVQQPTTNFDSLLQYQDAVRFWINHLKKWPAEISNGTLVMLEKFYESNDMVIDKPNAVNLLIVDIMQRMFHKNSHSFSLFSVHHVADFLKGCFKLTELLQESPPALLKNILEDIRHQCRLPIIKKILETTDATSNRKWLQLAYQSRLHLKNSIYRMMYSFAELDMLRSMAIASIEHHWPLPKLQPAEKLIFHAKGLIHPILTNPVGYDLAINQEQRFLFLTGANMSGKSTLLYAVGISALLAHLGMGVPAQEMEISFLKGIITNMHIEDNVALGESYFFAEVQRMKHTAEKLKTSRHHLVLMDELFKGTNGYDAYECSLSVIKGLLTKKENLMALSTHLSELSESLKLRSDIIFKYCQTNVDEKGHYEFTYQLKPGVSKDRIGFLVLKKEGVLDLLNQ